MEINLKQPTRGAKMPKIRETVVLSLFAALMLISKEALAALPNIELVTVLIILLTDKLGLKSLWSVYIFVGVQFLIYPSRHAFFAPLKAAYMYTVLYFVFAI